VLDNHLIINPFALYLPPLISSTLTILRIGLLPLVSQFVNASYPYQLMHPRERKKYHPLLEKEFLNKYTDSVHPLEGITYYFRTHHLFMNRERIKPRGGYFLTMGISFFLWLLVLTAALVHSSHSLSLLIIPLFVGYLISLSLTQFLMLEFFQLSWTGFYFLRIVFFFNITAIFIYLVLVLLYFQGVVTNIIGPIFLFVIIVACSIIVLPVLKRYRDPFLSDTFLRYYLLSTPPLMLNFILLILHHYVSKISYSVHFVPFYILLSFCFGIFSKFIRNARKTPGILQGGIPNVNFFM
jgi:hypothetical protein